MTLLLMLPLENGALNMDECGDDGVCATRLILPMFLCGSSRRALSFFAVLIQKLSLPFFVRDVAIIYIVPSFIGFTYWVEAQRWFVDVSSLLLVGFTLRYVV